LREFIESVIDKLDLIPDGSRYLLGIAGSPGAGKSTLAQYVVETVNTRHSGKPAIIVPMDGFHLDDRELDRKGLLHLKGVPESFDGEGFRVLIERLRQEPARQVKSPAFDRTLESTIADAILVEDYHRLAVVEGNYLLYQKYPWGGIRSLLDETWYIESTDEIILPRLRKRHAAGGRSEEGAWQKIESTDLPNARLIEETRRYADRVIPASVIELA
jgi:pantothenate kinase